MIQSMMFPMELNWKMVLIVVLGVFLASFVDGIAGGAAQEEDWDDPRDRDHSNKKDDPKDA